MKCIIDIISWSLLTLLFFSYIGYPLVIEFIKKRGRGGSVLFPDDTVIHLVIACYNEEAVIEEKIHNSFSIDHPRKLKVCVVIDKSTDKTSEIAHHLKKQYPNLLVLDKGYRKGKNDSINYFFKNVKPAPHDILFFTDANTFYYKDSFSHLWIELEAGASVVGGSMKYVDVKSNSAKSEGLYWKYEEWIRNNESKFGRCITMNGGNMAMVAGFFEELPTFVPNDFDIPIRLVSRNKTSFASKSIGFEKAILDKQEELKRKRRMANRQMNAIISRWSSFSFVTKIQLVFHKVLRWFALPVVVFIALLQLVSFFYGLGFLFYSLLYGWLLILFVLVFDSLFKNKIPVFNIFSYAFWVHYFSSIGAIMALFGRKVSIWGKASSNR